MSALFFDLQATHNPHRWYLPLTDEVCVGPPDNLFMYGGIGLASAIAAMERTCGRPVIWATAQYLSYARPPSIVDIDVWVPAEGKYNSQARVTGHVGDKEIFTVNAALGRRESPISQQWVTAPVMPRPQDCVPSKLWPDQGTNLNARLEVRMAEGLYGEGPRTGALSTDGRLVMWLRARDGSTVDASLLAIFADYVPSGVGAALGRPGGGNSLDNTLRIRRIVPTEWVLCDIHIQGIHGGFAHGDMRLFAEDGELMAMASQSVIVRTFEG